MRAMRWPRRRSTSPCSTGSNHHLFQPLLYQVATAALSPADIAWPIRGVLRGQANVRVLLAEVDGASTPRRASVRTRRRTRFAYDLLVVATGATHSYFGNDDWAAVAPGLKTHRGRDRRSAAGCCWPSSGPS